MFVFCISLSHGLHGFTIAVGRPITPMFLILVVVFVDIAVAAALRSWLPVFLVTSPIMLAAHLCQEWQQSTEVRLPTSPSSWSGQTWGTGSPLASQRWSWGGRQVCFLCPPTHPPTRSPMGCSCPISLTPELQNVKSFIQSKHWNQLFPTSNAYILKAGFWDPTNYFANA